MIVQHIGWYFALAAGLSALTTPIVLRLAKSLGLVDLPNVRKVHSIPTPRVGGLAFAFATLATLTLIWSLAVQQNAPVPHTRLLSATLLGAGLIALVGLADDVWGLSAKLKLIALISAGIGFCAAGGNITRIVVSGNTLLELGVASWPITILWIVVITVAFNFIDGLDGLAAGIGFFAAGVLAIASAVGGFPAGVYLGAVLAGALLGFLPFNYRPAKIFMGDCGSMFIGFMLATSMAMGNLSIGTTRAIVLPCLALSIPLFDLLFTMLRRGVLERRSLFAAERGHIHHQLIDAGLCHLHAVMLLHLLTLAGAMVALICLFCNYVTNTFSIVAFCVGLACLFRIAGSLEARSLVSAVRRNRALGRSAKQYQNAFYDLQLRFRRVNSFDAWWHQVCHAATQFDFAKLDLPLMDRNGKKSVKKWRRDGEPVAAGNSIIADIPVPQRRVGQTVRAQVEVIVAESLESAGQRIALFSRLMGEFGLSQLPDSAKRASLPVMIDISTAAKELSPAGQFGHLRVALVHDFLYTYAGAERVLEQLIAIFPHADLFSLFDFVPPEHRGFLQGKKAQPSFLQKMPFARKKHRSYLPLMPLAVEQMDVSDYDLVISSSYMVAKGVITRPDQLHVCYCHSPIRFAWDLQHQYLKESGLSRGIKSLFARIVLHYIRSWDIRSANGVDSFLCNSNFVGRRIEKVYRRKATTIYPPVDTRQFTLQKDKGPSYVTASRLVPYKRISLIVEAFNQMPDKHLTVIGEGPELERIRAIAKPNVRVLGYQSVDQLTHQLQHARAFVFAAEEDFGIAPVEAQACGTPVIALGRGGVTESVIDGVTGVLFDEQTVEAIIKAVARFETLEFNPAIIRRHSESFSTERFRKEISEFVRRDWTAFRAAQLQRTTPGQLSALQFDSKGSASSASNASAAPSDVADLKLS